MVVVVVRAVVVIVVHFLQKCLDLEAGGFGPSGVLTPLSMNRTPVRSLGP